MTMRRFMWIFVAIALGAFALAAASFACGPKTIDATGAGGSGAGFGGGGSGGSIFNPGPGLSFSIPFVLTLACFAMGMTLEESLVAATLNAAYAVDRHERVGSLEVGKQMDAVVLDGPLETLLAPGRSPVRAVVKKGRIVYESSDARQDARH